MHIDENKKFDRRTIERNLRDGTVSPEEWEKYLKGLPDVSENLDFILLEAEQKEESPEGQEETEATPEKEE